MSIEQLLKMAVVLLPLYEADHPISCRLKKKIAGTVAYNRSGKAASRHHRSAFPQFIAMSQHERNQDQFDGDGKTRVSRKERANSSHMTCCDRFSRSSHLPVLSPLPRLPCLSSHTLQLIIFTWDRGRYIPGKYLSDFKTFILSHWEVI